MTTTIDINGTLTLDQTSGIQPNDTAIGSDLTGLSTAFKDFLNGLTGDLQLSAGQLAFADNVEAAVSGAGLVTVNPDGATISKLFFSDGSGAPLDGDQVIYNGSPLLTVDGSQPIYLHSYANGTIVLATTSAAEGVGDVVAAFYLKAAGDNLTASVEMVTFQAIAHPDSTNPDDTIDWTNLLNVSATGSTSFNFDNLASGNNLFVAVGTSGAGLVVSGIHPVIHTDGTLDNSGDNIKTSQGGIGATIGVNNQMFDPGETAVFSFVKGQAPGTYGDIDNMSYTDFIDVTDAKLFISQTEGSPGTNFTVKIGAFSAGGASTDPEAGRSYIDNNLGSGANLGNDGVAQSALKDDTVVAIVRVIIRDGNGVVLTTANIGDVNSYVTFNADGTITAQHLNDSYTVQWFTDNSGTQAVETFNRFQATAVVGKFDVGRVDLSQGVTVTESVGDKLHTNDDGPSISTTGNEPTLTVDETVLTTDAHASFAGNFISSFGTDGAGTLTYALSAVAGPSGLVDTATNQTVILSLNGGVVEGRTATSHDLVFTVSVDGSGNVTLDQLRAVVHPTSDPDESKTLNADNLVQLTATITDKDGDHAPATLNIGQNLIFKDDGPSISTTGNEPTLTVDETVLTTDAHASFAGNFISSFGTDGAGTLTYALSAVAGPSGLVDTATNQTVILSLNGGVVEGRTATSHDLVFTVFVDGSGNVTLDQLRAVVHPTSDPDESKTLNADNLIQLTATVTDKDGDHAPATLNIGQNLIFKDDGPSISTTGTEPTLTVDETVLGPDATQSFVTSFSSTFGADGAGTLTYALGFNAGVTGLVDTLTDEAVVLSLNGAVLEGRTATSHDLVFTVSVNAAGAVTLDQIRAVVHPDANDPDDSKTLSADSLVQLTATITDKDGDQASATLNIGTNLIFKDDAPTITVPFDGDQSGTPGTPETLANTLNASATGNFGYDIGADSRPASFYDATHSDFVDADGALAGIQIGLTGNLTGLVPAPGTTPFISSFATLQSESATSATFNWQISYDSDPNTAGNQTATAGGTLVFNKVADTYTITLNDTVEGFTKDILHTSELLSKEPVSNVGHPNIVVEKLFDASTTTDQTDRDFFVQFTGNSNPNGSPFGFNATGDGNPVVGGVNDTIFNAGQQISSNFEDWVSATQATNGVAGDTIQKGELLTLRFFDHSPGIITDDGANNVPNQTANDMAIKFDGIGNSEDLMLILNLVNFGTDGIAGGTGTAADTFTTKAMYVSNADIFKTGQVPTAYAADFPLDNNDGLVIVERNDYNGAGENWVLQGVQIMQSGNGLTGPDSNPNLAGLQETPTAIDLQRATGPGGGSTTFALQNWDPTDNDVLKITDIGFTSTQTTTPDAHLDFAFRVADADGDTTPTSPLFQHILVDVA